MRIVYDYQVFSRQIYGGISRYFAELARRFSAKQGVEARIFAPLYINSYARELNGPIVRGKYLQTFSRFRCPLEAFNRLCFQSWSRRFKPDIIHETYYTKQPISKGDSVKTVITVFDMIHEKFPNCFSSDDLTSQLKAHAVERADHVICISENTRLDLVEILGVAKTKTSVVHLGWSHLDRAAVSAPALIAEPYILFVGRRGGYKNFENLLRAYANSTYLNREYSLVCFGGGQFTNYELALIDTLSLPLSNLRYESGSDDVLASLYASANAFIYPSLYEGFGIPPLEAMSFGCPVVCSDAGALPEVVGDAAMFFDPADVDQMGAAIESVVSSPAIATRLADRGKRRVRHFSWEQCARDTLQVYRKTIEV